MLVFTTILTPGVTDGGKTNKRADIKTMYANVVGMRPSMHMCACDGLRS